jgi:hypothetical protein
MLSIKPMGLPQVLRTVWGERNRLNSRTRWLIILPHCCFVASLLSPLVARKKHFHSLTHYYSTQIALIQLLLLLSTASLLHSTSDDSVLCE